MAADPPSTDAATEFVGRGWLVAAVRDWAASGSSYLFLTGGPGTGKSAVVDHLWGRDPVAGTAVHRCRSAGRGSVDPVRFAASLAEQFSTTVPGFADALVRVAGERSGQAVALRPSGPLGPLGPLGQPGQPGLLRIEGTATAGTVHPHASVIGAQVSLSLSHVTADEAFEQLVCRPLELLAPAQRPVAVVDGLDEALTHRGSRTIAELVLSGVDRLPLRFVLTTRHDARITAVVRDLPDAVLLDLVDDAPDPDADLLAYARHRLRGPRGAGAPREAREAAARRLAAAGEGNYLYVLHLTQEAADGARTVDELAATALPYGLDGVYREFMRREIRPVGSADAEERWRTAFRPLLDLLVAAREDGFTAGRLADLLDRTEQEVLDTVRVLGQYLRGRDRRGPWTLFHRSFEEFLLSGDDPHLDAGEGHRRIADHAFTSWADAWDGCDDPYLLQHLTDHLLTAAECTTGRPGRGRTLQDRLYTLATSAGYLAAQRAVAPGRELHLVTLHRALRASLAAQAYPRSAGLALRLVGAGAEADEETPVQAALRWGAAAGVAKARTHPQDTALLWLLLIVAALGARAPDEATAPLEEIAAGGLRVAGQRWAPAVAALLAPLLPRLTSEQAGAVMDVADDDLLGHLAAFLLEEAGPEAAVPPALRIRENVARARAVEGILTRAALSALTGPMGTDPGGLGRLGALIAAGHLPPQDDARPWASPLAEPDVADSVLLVHAARGELDGRLPELADRTARAGGELSDAAVLLARIVQAARIGPAGAPRARMAGRAALADPRRDIRGLLHHTATMVRIGDLTAPALLDALVEELPAYEHDLHAGHVDGFHGWCGVGLRLAVVRLLAAAGQGDRARREADRLRTNHPAEHVRALAWMARDETRPGPRAALVAAAREAADRIPHSLCAQAYRVLADADRPRLADTLARTAGRRRPEPVVSGPARAALAWAAHVRGDRRRAETLGAEAAAWFTALPRDRRRQQDADRLVKNLLRARLPAEAVRVTRTPTTGGEAGLMNLGDVRNRLAAHAEHTELTLLRQAEGATTAPDPADPADPAGKASPYEQALTMRVRRAGEDRQAFEESRVALRRTVQGVLGSLARLPEDVWIPGGADEEGAVWCLLQAVGLEWPEGSAAASREWNRALERATFSAGFEHPVGHRPRDVEIRDEADVLLRRSVQAAAELAEAFHDIGDEGEAGARFARAVAGAREISDPGHRIRAFTELAGTAARLGRYDDLRLLRPEAARMHGGSLGDVAETLAVTVLRGGPDGAGARRALEEIVGSPGLPHLDHVDLLAALAVITPGTEIEEQLLAAAATAATAESGH
ncbi:hypothetical protein AB0O18_31275 [Streptomyces sp. NPDC093224]|uniref:hypothetical protein n=1 Tax=Streptomyces sp. NPDC093224 TaxID=3155198 RepID=UPI003425EA5D